MGDRIGLDCAAQEVVEHLHVGCVNRDNRKSSRPDCPRDRAHGGVAEEASARVATRSRIVVSRRHLGVLSGLPHHWVSGIYALIP
jgi:hypothetical protein